MKRYTVTWVESATEDLARFWMKAKDQQAIADAADLADSSLAVDPETKSDVLSEGLRAVTVGPLRLFFVIREADRQVQITYVKRIVRQ